MKYALKFILLFSFTNWMIAQSASFKLTGYYTSTSNKHDSSLLFNTTSVVEQSLLFKSRNQLQRVLLINKPSSSKLDTLIYNSRFSRNYFKREISFLPKNDILLNTGNLLVIDKFKSSIHVLSDTSFQLLNNTFYRQKQAPPLLTPPLAKTGSFYIQSLENETQQIRIPLKKVTLQIDESGAGGTQLSRLNTTECTLDTLLGDSLKISLLSEEIEIENRNRFSTISTNYFAGSFNKTHKMIALNDILYVQMKSPLRQTLSQIGAVIMTAGVLLMVSSPFAGMQMNDANRAEARNRIFTAGISCFGVSLPFLITGRNKKYLISPDYQIKKEKHWVILQSK